MVDIKAMALNQLVFDINGILLFNIGKCLEFSIEELDSYLPFLLN